MNTTEYDNSVRQMAARHTDKFKPGFVEWLTANPHVWRAFEREAMQVWARGRRHYSARTIVEVLRHHTIMRERDSEWKLNNNNVPDLARLYLLMRPEHAGLFELRDMRNREAEAA
jgi:hypothetical protein